MLLNFLYPIKDMSKCLQREKQPEELWDEIMISPYWTKISEWAGDSCDFMKPKSINNFDSLKKQIEIFSKFDYHRFETECYDIIKKLPKDDEDPMTIAIYPSENNLAEGVYGACVWGNIIINANANIKDYFDWIPFVFAHEYHHTVLGFYWYVKQEGKETKGNFLESMINEGQADEFAKSLYPYRIPSWHKGVKLEDEHRAWQLLKNVLYEIGTPQEQERYMFGNKELGIPPFAGYYFGSKIVASFLKEHPNISFNDLIEIPHHTIYEESIYRDL